MHEMVTDHTDEKRIRRNWAKAVAAGDIVGRIFYAKLFEIAPESRAMFPAIIDDQAGKLQMTLNWIVDHLDDTDQLVPAAQGLAIRHVGYGVMPAHYPAVGHALIATLRQGLGTEFSPEDEAAWARTYEKLSSLMISAAYPDG